MPTYELTDPETGITIELTGDSPPTEQEAIMAFANAAPSQGLAATIPSGPISTGQQTSQPQTDRGFFGASYIEPAVAIASSMALEPISGLAGLAASPFVGNQGAVDIIKAIQAQSYTPGTAKGIEGLQTVAEKLKPIGEFFGGLEQGAGDIGFNIGGPIGGAIGTATPTAAMEALGLGLGAGIRRVGQTSKRTEARAAQKTVDNIEPEAKSMQQIADQLKTKDPRSVTQVMPDAQIIQSAKELNIDLNPSHYSTNRAYIDVEQGLKSRPGSTIANVEVKAIKDLGNRADDLVNELGGTTDKSLVDINIKGRIDKTINRLSTKSDLAYRKISEVPGINRALVEPKSSIEYINGLLDDLGEDVSQLSSAEKKLLALSKAERPPTYAALDRLRRDVGSALSKKGGPYKDDASGSLKQVYKMLSEDQQGAATAFGVGKEYEMARKLVSLRKGVEDNAVALFGREVSGSIVPKLRSAATSLSKGDISKFESLMRSIPKSRRAEASATMLNDIFTQGSKTGKDLGQGFVAAWEGLNRNRRAKSTLFANLPVGAQKRFDDIGRVAKGIFNAMALENKSRTGRDIVAAMNDAGMFGKVYGFGKNVALAEGAGSSVGAPGLGTTAVIAATIAKKATPATQAADTFITSPAFKSAINAAATGDTVTAENILRKSSAFNRWVSFAPKTDAANIATIGFIPWVIGQDNGQ